MTVTHQYDQQIGGVIINPDDGDNEYDYIISAEHNHGAGTVAYSLDVFEGEEVYRRNVPNTAEWRAQALADIEEAAQERHPDAVVYVHLDATDDE